MTLTNRLTLFYLVTLGAVLAAFAGSAYWLISTLLFRQLSDRATGTLDTLVAAAEIEPDGIDWEPQSRKLQLGTSAEPLWAVYDGAGKRVDGAKAPVHSLDGFAVAELDMEQSRLDATWAGQPWWVMRRTIHHPRPENVGREPKPNTARYSTLVFVTAWPLAPLQQTLRTLLWSVVGLSALVWLIAAGAGRWLSRRALAPVTRMANAVRGFTVDDLGERLPLPHPQDELHELASSFNGLLTRLQESFERQKRFTGEASHQLRTPLSGMLGQIEVALRRERQPEEYRQVLGTARAQAECSSWPAPMPKPGYPARSRSSSRAGSQAIARSGTRSPAKQTCALCPADKSRSGCPLIASSWSKRSTTSLTMPPSTATRERPSSYVWRAKASTRC
jgi:HAMP domain-containing protein